MKVAGVLKAVKVAGSLRRQAVDMVARAKVGGRKPAQENAEARGDKVGLSRSKRSYHLQVVNTFRLRGRRADG
jgi:hypothetical protein